MIKILKRHPWVVGFVILAAVAILAVERDRSYNNDLAAVEKRLEEFHPFNDGKIVATPNPDGNIDVVFDLCNTANRPVNALTSFNWVAVDTENKFLRPNAVSLYAALPDVIEPGCQEIDLDTSTVPALYALDEDLPESAQWRLTVVYTPLRLDGTTGNRTIVESNHFDLPPNPAG